MTDDQKTAIDKAREAALRLKTFADKARVLGLPVLEQWLRDASVGCQAGADFQERAFKDNLLSQSGKVVIDREPRDNVTRSPMLEGGERQADAIADAMKRKGLV